MEPTASSFAQKKRSSVEYDSHERSDGSACDIIDGFEINSFESEEQLNCFIAKKQKLGPRYQPDAMKEGSEQFIDPSIQIKIEPSLSDEWMEIDEQSVDDESIIFEEMIGWSSSFDRLDVDPTYDPARNLIRLVRNELPMKIINREEPPKYLDALIDGELMQKILTAASEDEAHEILKDKETEEMGENVAAHEVEPQIVLPILSDTDEAASSPQNLSSHSGADARLEKSGLLTSLPMSLDSLTPPSKQGDEYMAPSADDEKTQPAIYDDPELNPPPTVQAPIINAPLPLLKVANRAEALHTTASGLSTTRFTPVMQKMLVTVNGRQILIPVINISSSNGDIRGTLLSNTTTKVIMDQPRSSSEMLSNVTALSGPVSLMSTTDTLPDSTTLMDTTPACISGSLPSGGNQSPTVPFTTTPSIATVNGDNPCLASTSSDGIAASSSKILKLMNKKSITREMKRFQCQYCEKTFLGRNKKTIHERIHNGEKPYCCDICLRSFSQSSNLKTHKRNVHSTEQQPSKSLYQRSNQQENEPKADNHSIEMIESVENNKKEENQQSRSQRFHKCDVCGKIFSRKHHLLSHLLIHSGEKPFKCQLCDQSFRKDSNLARHKLTHTGEKRHNCASCDKKFSQLDGLKRHQKRVHPEDQPFKCEICSKSFMQLHQLHNHGKVHTLGDIEDKDDSHLETDKSGERVENVSYQGPDIRSQGEEMLKEKTEIDDYWVRRYGLRDCYVKLQNFVHRLPDKAFL